MADAKRLEDNQMERFDFERKTDKVERERERERERKKRRDLTLKERQTK